MLTCRNADSLKGITYLCLHLLKSHVHEDNIFYSLNMNVRQVVWKDLPVSVKITRTSYLYVVIMKNT